MADEARRIRESAGLDRIDEIMAMSRPPDIDIVEQAKRLYDTMGYDAADELKYINESSVMQALVGLCPIDRQNDIIADAIAQSISTDALQTYQDAASEFINLSLPHEIEQIFDISAQSAMQPTWDWMKTIYESRAFEEQISKDIDAVLNFTKTLAEFTPGEFSLNPDNTLTISEFGRVLDIEDVLASLNEITRLSAFRKASTHREVIIIIENEIPKKKSCLQRTLRWLFAGIFLNVISTQIGNYVLPAAQKFCTEVIKTQNSKMDEHLNIMRSFEDLRFVTASTLNVREHDNISSQIIGALHAGQVIRVIEERGDWCLIEYLKDECSLRGWVSSHYLRTFK